MFDQADQVEVIDIEPEELIDRMKEGKIYGPIQAERALQNFFRREKLAALREIALRRSADRVNRIAEEERNVSGKYWSIIQESIYWHVFPLRHPAPR